MKVYTLRTKLVAIGLLAVVILSSCASTTLIDSYPSGADLYLNGEAVGQTPYEMTDTKILYSCTTVRLEKKDYKTFYTTICRNEEADVGAIIGGVLFYWPFLWALKYKPTHFYRLRANDSPDDPTNTDFNSLIDEENE